jgi:hypothetical protein
MWEKKKEFIKKRRIQKALVICKEKCWKTDAGVMVQLYCLGSSRIFRLRLSGTSSPNSQKEELRTFISKRFQ